MLKPNTVLQDESPEGDVPMHDEPAAATDKAQTWPWFRHGTGCIYDIW